MIDFHTHTLLSDGALIPAEHIRRAEVAGYRILGLADHGDIALLEHILRHARMAAEQENAAGRLRVLAGIELTHMRPTHIADGTARARDLGAQFVVCHGETIAEPVEPGTNRAAIEAGVDILAHPGLITEDDARLAAERGVALEISGKAGHSLCNGHVAAMARKVGAQLLFGSDAHTPEQMPTRDKAERICRGAGLGAADVAAMFAFAETLADTFASRGV